MSLEVKNLRVYYQTLRGDVKALDGVTFNIKDGEIMGVAGESGCGKTTLANSIIYLTPPMKYIEGSVKLDNEELPIWDMHKMNLYRYKNVSIIPQYAMNAMNPTRKIGKMTAELLVSKRVNYKKTRPKLERRLDLVELNSNILGMYPIELSGGMKQRMVLVLSTLLDPSLLIADEVTSALDVSTQKAVGKMLVEFRDRKFVKNIIVITHDISILYQIADSILVMYAGKLAEKASTDVIINSPVHPYTRLLISTLPKVGIKYSEKKLVGIKGNTPLLLDPPIGCRFKDRCPAVSKKCEVEPPFIEIEKDHFVACWKEFDKNA
jgi:peptide/nickel transport system ATP-binding protein